MTYTLLRGEHAIADSAALAALRKDLPKSAVQAVLFGGEDLDEVMQFVDVAPGDVTVCAEARRPKESLGLACTTLTVHDDVHAVTLDPTAAR